MVRWCGRSKTNGGMLFGVSGLLFIYFIGIKLLTSSLIDSLSAANVRMLCKSDKPYTVLLL